MSTITQIRLWYDTGFTEGCTEVPKINGSLPTPSLTYDASFTPSTSDIFSRLKLRVPYTTLMNCSYLAISLDMNNGADKVFYGWIDKVNIISDTESNPLTEILWHVDLWRTYISSVTVGSGMVNRRPLLTNDSVPPQNYPFRYTISADTPVALIDDSLWYIIFTFNWKYTQVVTNDDGTTTETNIVSAGTGYFPISYSSPSARQAVGTFSAPSFNEVIKGEWDELLGMDPESIKGTFLSPMKPHYNNVGWSSFKIPGVEAPLCGFYKATSPDCISETSYTFNSAISTDDVNSYYITGFDGEIIGELPWGMPITQLNKRLIIDSSAAYLQIRAGDIKSHVNGVCFTIPLPPVEVSSNSWSSYVYSGARASDIAQKRTEADQARESTYVSTISNVSSSVASSAMLGSLGGPVGSLGGALIGGASSLISGTVGAEANYALTTKYNDAFQNITDYRTARQTDGLIMSGSGFDAVRFGQKPTIIKAVKDEYSVQQRANDISLYGVHVSEPRSSCQSLIAAGGPVQITNAVVKGSVPVEAKQYIRQRLAQGVRMI